MYGHIFLPHLCQQALWVFMDMLHQPLSGQTTKEAGVIDRILLRGQGVNIKQVRGSTDRQADEEILDELLLLIIN